jgi:hypothetical protein
MSYLVGSMETHSSGGMVPALGQTTIQLPNVKRAVDLWAEGYRNLLPQKVTPTDQTQTVVNAPGGAAPSGVLTEEQIKAMLAAGGDKPASGGLLESLPPWALPVGLAAVVGGFLLMRKKG